MKVTGDFSSSGVNKYRFRIRERRGRESEEGGGWKLGSRSYLPLPLLRSVPARATYFGG